MLRCVFGREEVYAPVAAGLYCSRGADTVTIRIPCAFRILGEAKYEKIFGFVLGHGNCE